MLEKLKRDIEQYNGAISDYSDLETEDIDTAYVLAKELLILADRWNEIMLESAKYCTELEISRTSFEKYAYHKYRVLMTAHEFCRVVWRQGKENYKNSFNEELV